MTPDRLRNAMTRALQTVMGLDNVVGVGLGRKETGGQPTRTMSVTVLVSKKLPRDALPRTQMVPRSVGDGASTDVIEVGEIRLLDLPRTGRMRPAPGGASVAHYRVTAGTLGGLVRDRETGDLLILSNNHVLANLSDGTDGRAGPGDQIVQPSVYDRGDPDRDVIAHLYRFVPLYRGAQAPRCPVARSVERVGNRVVAAVSRRYELRLLRRGSGNLVDAAVGRPVSEDDVTQQIIGLGVPTGVARPEAGQTIRKSGRTSGVSSGTVRVVEAALHVLLPDGETALFEDQIITSEMARPGDSGSFGLDDDNRVIGLLCAGSNQATMFCRMDHVQSLLNVDVATDA